MKHIFEYLFSKKSDLDKIKTKHNDDLYIVDPFSDFYSWLCAESRRNHLYQDVRVGFLWILTRDQIIYLCEWKGKDFIGHSKFFRCPYRWDVDNIMKKIKKIGIENFKQEKLDDILDFQYPV